MILVRWMRQTTGYVRFEATGAFVERFLNLIVREGISIWDIRREREVFSACTRAADYKRMRHLAKKAMIRLRIVEKHGAPFETKRYRRRYGLAAGAAVFLLFLMVMGQFIWNIKVEGNETMSSQEILEVLQQYGLRVGAFSSSVDVRDLQNKAMLELEELSWIAINIQGSTATVEVKERTMPPEMYPDDDKVSNVIAKKDGQIVRMEVYSGQKVAALGDTVSAGDLIVSGIMEDKAGKTSFKHARAKVIAQTIETLEVEVPLEKKTRVPDGESRVKRSVMLFGKEIPLYLGSISPAMQVQRQERRFNLPFTSLGVTIIEYTVTPMREELTVLTEHEAKEEAMALLKKQEEQALRDAEILDRQVTGSLTQDRLILKGEYRCEEDIAQEQEVYVAQDSPQKE